MATVSMVEGGGDESPKERKGSVTEIAGQLLREAYEGEPAVAMPQVGKWRCGLCMRRLLVFVLTLVAVIILTPFFAILARHLHRNYGLWSTIDAISAASVCRTRDGFCALQAADVAGAELLDVHSGRTPLLGFLYAQVSNKSIDVMSEILRGAHVEIEDPNTTSYNFLANLTGAYRRESSHESDAPTYGIHLGGHLNTILFSKLGHRTWLQFEGADEKSQPLLHNLDFWEYKITWRNIGPLGTSWYTDSTPLDLDETVLVDSVCSSACAETAPASEEDPSGVTSQLLSPREDAFTA